MNKHYTEVGEIIIPAHENEESVTTLHVFDVDDEKAAELYEAKYGASIGFAAWEIVRDDLNICDDYGVPPGAPFHRYTVDFVLPHTVLLYDTMAYNV